MKKKAYPGYFVSFEGGEGSGKSTQAKRISNWLRSLGLPVVLTREPGGTAAGAQIRQLLLDPVMHIHARTEMLLYAADRAQHVEEVILPALREGKTVLCDRYVESSVVYQGMARKLGTELVRSMNNIATGGLRPDCIILLDLPEGKIPERLAGKEKDRLENEAHAFHRAVRKGFQALARKEKSRFCVLKADLDKDLLTSEIQKNLQSRLTRKKLWKV